MGPVKTLFFILEKWAKTNEWKFLVFIKEKFVTVSFVFFHVLENLFLWDYDDSFRLRWLEMVCLKVTEAPKDVNSFLKLEGVIPSLFSIISPRRDKESSTFRISRKAEGHHLFTFFSLYFTRYSKNNIQLGIHFCKYSKHFVFWTFLLKLIVVKM